MIVKIKTELRWDVTEQQVAACAGLNSNARGILVLSLLALASPLFTLRTSAQTVASETNSLGGQFRNWLSQPGDFKQIIYSVPGSEYEFLRTKTTLDGPMYYEIGKQGASFYSRHLTNIGNAWTKWPNPGLIAGASANGDCWVIYENNLTHQRTVAIQPLSDAPASYKTNDLAVTTTLNEKLNVEDVGSLGFPSVIPGTLRWLSEKDFEAEVVAMASREDPKPRGALTGSIVDQDNLGRPKRIAFKNSFSPPDIETFMDYAYDGGLIPSWFPSRIQRVEDKGRPPDRDQQFLH